MTENRLFDEIKKLVDENTNTYIPQYELNEIALAIYDLMEESANEYYNIMKINKEEFGTPARFNHWAINHFKK